jgi:hypothetical protein
MNHLKTDLHGSCALIIYIKQISKRLHRVPDPSCSEPHAWLDPKLRASPTVLQIAWASFFFEKKTQKPISNSLAYKFGIFGELAKERAIGAYMPASRSRASAWHRSFSRGSSLLSGALRSLSGPLRFLAGLLSFWNEICHTVGDAIFFFLPILFWELANNEIWETKFAKLFEMLLVYLTLNGC